ncbi:MAG TPA: FAD-dependent oxidoreductase [Syntrophomonas sp.]|nr:FAD-dependent oxidoreductase [Syntrophomonas sp.]
MKNDWWVPSKWDYETDVLVCGYGCGGSAAAIDAHDAGAEVLILEKMPKPGGSVAESGFVIMASETSAQKKFGIEDSADEFYKYLVASGGGFVDPKLMRIIADESASLIDWLIGLGLPYDNGDVYQSGAEIEYEAAAKPAPRGHRLPFTIPNYVAWDSIVKQVEKRGIQTMCNTRAMNLVADPKTKEVFGVKALKDGKEVYIRANKGVILATGGFNWNMDLMKAYLPEYVDCWTIVPPGAEGDGLIMAQRLGCAITTISMRPDMNPGLRGKAIYPDRDLPFAAGWARFAAAPRGPGIFVNTDGKRFVKEMQFYDLFCPAIVRQKGCKCFAIFDEDARTVDNTIDQFIGYVFQSKHFEKEIAAGDMKQVDTIEQLAKIVGCDAAALKATIDKWNTDVANGVDTEFGNDQWLMPIKKPPFSIAELRPATTDAVGGVKINENAEVIDLEGQIIPRLYAPGTLSGGWKGQIYPGSGWFMSGGFTFGRIAGKKAAASKPSKIE